jgi:RNA polymerase sigma factor (sigma-70 family)
MDNKREALVEAFEQMYDEQVKRIKGRVPNVGDAEDIVMTAYTKALGSLDRYDSTLPIGAWLNTIIQNSAKDWVRDNRLQGMTVEIDEKNGGMYEFMGVEAATSATMLNEVTKLRPGFKKDVLYRRFFMGLTIAGIAEAMDTGTERVKKCVMRWRSEMKGKYGVEV